MKAFLSNYTCSLRSNVLLFYTFNISKQELGTESLKENLDVKMGIGLRRISMNDPVIYSCPLFCDFCWEDMNTFLLPSKWSLQANQYDSIQD